MKKKVIFEGIVCVVLIFLCFILYVMVTNSGPAVEVKWEKMSNEPVVNTLTVEDGTLYAFMYGNISAIDEKGNKKWDLSVPDDRWVCSVWDVPVTAWDNGTLYVFVRPSVDYSGNNSSSGHYGQLIAISPEGKVMWSIPLRDELWHVDIFANNGRVYVHHGYTNNTITPGGGGLFEYGYNEIVIDNTGRELWRVCNISAPAAVDEHGYVYMMSIKYMLSPPDDVISTINAYYPDGTAYWTRNVTYPNPLQATNGKFCTYPIYHNNLLYALSINGVQAIERNGSVKWNVDLADYGYIELYGEMPFDDEGNIYLKCHYYEYSDGIQLNKCDLAAISPDGKFVIYPSKGNARQFVCAKDGIGYSVDKVGAQYQDSIRSLDSVRLTAYDIRNDSKLWSCTIPVNKNRTIKLNGQNARKVLYPAEVGKIAIYNRLYEQWKDFDSSTPASVSSTYNVKVLPGEDFIYVNFWTYKYEYPAIYNQSSCTYAGDIYAIDMDGNIVWEKQTDSFVTSMSENKGNVYYSTYDGKISGAIANIVQGITVATIVYVLIRFILIGTISRAKSRMDKNRNRNSILNYIIDNPGSTMYDISRGLGMNLGTVRYHLLILGINHCIAEHRTDNKYVRYFPNSNTYSNEQKVIMSLIRRDTIYRTLSVLLAKPGISNHDLSMELNISDSAMSGCMKELLEAGLVEKEYLPGNKTAYLIKEEYRGQIEKAIERVKTGDDVNMYYGMSTIHD